LEVTRRVLIDHVCWLVPDAAATTRSLDADLGLAVEVGMYYPLAGTQHYNVWLQPPQLLEFMTITDREAAARSASGRAVLACEARGYGLFSWAVLVDDLESVSARLDIQIVDYTVPHGDGTLRGWRTVSGPDHLPFFIDYPNNGDRADRIQTAFARAGHRCSPTHFSALTVRGSEREMLRWLGPNRLPIHFESGEGGIVAAEIASGAGPLLIG
jgi:hypothetical protein